jgi:RNA polymerase primary sigma factor
VNTSSEANDTEFRGLQLLRSYWKDIKGCQPVSREAERLLVTRAKAGDEHALAELASSNLRFVVSIAKEYSHLGRSMNELISDGNMGLMEAARRFDENRGFKFITYAVWWIRQSIRRGLSKGNRTVPPPPNRVSDLRVVLQADAKLAQTLGRYPTATEVTKETGLSARRVTVARATGATDMYLDRPQFPGEEESQLTMLSADEQPVDTEIDESTLTDTVLECLESLDGREKRIIRCYFGFDGRSPMTLEQIGHEFGLTRERIRQLRDRGLKELRVKHGDKLSEFSKN